MEWFRFYAKDWLTDPKIATLTTAERECLVTLLCLVCVSGNPDGFIDPIMEENLVLRAGVWPGTPQWDDTKGVLEKLRTLNIVTISDSNVTPSGKKVTLKNWMKRQWITTTSAERMRKHRASKKGTVTDDANIPSVSVSVSVINKEIVSRFDRFWSVYPRKASKKKALETWVKLAPSEDLTQKIIAAVKARAQTKDWQKEDGAFIPHPTTYLNQERWTDQVGISKPEIKNKYTERGL